MNRSKKAAMISFLAIFLLLSNVLTGCCPKKKGSIVLDQSKVQKMSTGDSANFSGYLLSNGALTTLLEKAESCTNKEK